MRQPKKTFHFFRSDSGLYHGRSVTCGEEVASAAAAEAGCIAVPDVEFPWAVQWVDGELREYRGTPPGDEYEWNEKLRRWWLKPEVEAARLQREAAAAQIKALEERQQRAMREHAIGRGGTPAQLKKRLEDIDDQITALREALNN